MNILNDVMGCRLLTGMTAQCSYCYILLPKLRLKHERVFALELRLNDGGATSKSLGIFHLDNTRLYIATSKQLSIVISGAKKFVNYLIMPAPCHATTFYNSPKMFLRVQEAVFVDLP